MKSNNKLFLVIVTVGLLVGAFILAASVYNKQRAEELESIEKANPVENAFARVTRRKGHDRGVP